MTTKSGIVIEESASTAQVIGLFSKMVNVLVAQLEHITMLTKDFVSHAHLTLFTTWIRRSATAPITSPITMALSALCAEITKFGTTTEESASTAQVTDLSSRTASVLPAQPALTMMPSKDSAFPAHPT